MLEECVDGQGELGEIIMNNSCGNLNTTNVVNGNEAEVFAILSSNAANNNANDDLQ